MTPNDDEQLKVVLGTGKVIDKVGPWWMEVKNKMERIDRFLDHIKSHQLLEYPSLLLPKLFASIVFQAEKESTNLDNASNIFNHILVSLGREHFPSELVWPVLRSLYQLAFKDALRFWIYDQSPRTFFTAKYHDKVTQLEIPLATMKYRNLLLYQNLLLVLLSSLITFHQTFPPKDLLVPVGNFLKMRVAQEREIRELIGGKPPQGFFNQISSVMDINFEGVVFVQKSIQSLEKCYDNLEVKAKADFHAIIKIFNDFNKIIKGLKDQ